MFYVNDETETFRCRAYWTTAYWCWNNFGRKRLVCSACGNDKKSHAPIAEFSTLDKAEDYSQKILDARE